MFFNGSEVADLGYELIPEGDWPLLCHDVEFKAAKSGAGKYIRAEFVVIGECDVAGRKVFEMFNIEHSNPKVQMIGRGQFKAFLKAIAGRDSLESEKQLKYLIGKQVIGRVKITKGRDGDDQNKVRKWMPINTQEEATQQPQPQQQPTNPYFRQNAPHAQQQHYTPPTNPQPQADIDDIPF